MENETKLPREFWHFIGARLFFVLGIRMITTIVIYQVFHLTKSTYMVGIAGLAEFIPAVLSALYAGHYIDRHNKKNILVWSYLLYLLCGIALALVSFDRFGLSPASKVTVIFCVVFCTGIIRSFAGPAANSMIAAIVPRPVLQKAISLNSSTWLVSSIGGHATGGLLIAVLGISNGYFVTALLISVAAVFAFLLQPKPPVVQHKEPTLEAIKHGFKFVFNNKTLLGVISLDLFAVLFGGAVAFIPEIAENVLHTNAVGYGFLNAAMDIGSLISIALLLWMPMRRKQGLKMLLAVAGFGIFIIVFGLSKVYWLCFLSLALAGICDAISVVVRGTIMQLNTPDELRGRVASINLIFINSSNELGQFESGVTSKWLGTVPAIIFGGSMSVLIVIAAWLRFPNLKKIEY